MKMDAQLLQAALMGYQKELERIEEAMAELRRRIGQNPGDGVGTTPKRTISPAARKRMAAAQKKRWAAYRKNKTAGQ